MFYDNSKKAQKYWGVFLLKFEDFAILIIIMTAIQKRKYKPTYQKYLHTGVHMRLQKPLFIKFNIFCYAVT